MKTIKDKYLVVGADFAGYPLKEAVVAHLKEKGWKITDLGVVADSDPNDTENMFHRVGLRVGARISEGEFERAIHRKRPAESLTPQVVFVINNSRRGSQNMPWDARRWGRARVPWFLR